jgi:hypothetical protein
MPIDGRDIALARARAEADAGRAPSSIDAPKDAYESPLIRLLSHAIVWVPAALVVWFAYVSGTWMGGWTMGVLSVVSAALTVGVLWLWYKVRKRRN